MPQSMLLHFLSFCSRLCNGRIFRQWKTDIQIKCGSVSQCYSDYGISKYSALLTSRILFVFVNSLYSFWWDVAMDWNLTILTDPSAPGPKLWGLRKVIHFPRPSIYY